MDDEYLQSGRALALDLSIEQLARLFEGTWKWGMGGIPRSDGKGWIVSPTICADGPLGLRVERGKEILPSVLYPSPAAMASTWDADLERRLGAAVGRDARARGVDVVLAPGVNIKRNPRGGRSFEYLSEDPLLSGVMGASFVSGVQSQGVGCCVKHYLCNSQETGRFSFDARPSEIALMDIYYPAFERVAEESDPWCVMLAYNDYYGTPCSASRELTSLLVERTGYRGCFISDWGAVSDSVAALAGGLNVQMPGLGGDVYDAILPALKSDQSLQARARDSAARVLALNFRAEAARGTTPEGRVSDSVDVALEGARESIIILKNDGVLPLVMTEPVAFIGARAANPLIQGNGSSRVRDIDREVSTPVDEFSSRHRCAYSVGYRLGQDVDLELEREAVELAERAGTAVCFLGVESFDDAEGADRLDISLPDNQIELSRKLIESSAKTVFVIQAGCAVDISFLEGADAIVYQYLGGRSASLAIAEVLLGEINPSGHLAESLPLPDEIPFGDRFPVTGKPDLYPEGELVGYRWYDTFDRPVNYSFGYGLSYSTFEYSSAAVSSPIVDPESGIDVSMEVSNTSDIDGAQVIQVYLRPERRIADRPVHWLAGFARVEVEAHSSRTASIHIAPREFSLWHPEVSDYSLVEGRFTVEISVSSRECVASLQVKVKPGDGAVQFPLDEGEKPDMPSLQEAHVDEDEAVESEQKVFDRESKLVDVLKSRWILRKIQGIFISRTRKQLGIPSLDPSPRAENYLWSNLEYPIRFASVIGLSSRMIDGLLAIANHHGLRGTLLVLTGLGNRQKRAEKRVLKIERHRAKKG